MSSGVKKNKLASTLPFDQYSRQMIVARLIDDTVRVHSKEKKLRIIDLGGHKGKTTEFQPKDTVTILDVFNESYENYVKGDATKTKFSDNEFDVAVSFDVFEHIPRPKRKEFLSEALRISSFGVFVAMPVDVGNKVASAEVRLNDFYKTAYSKDHPWLKEHIEYRIPSESEVLTLVKNEGAYAVSISTNQVGDWQLMQMLIFASIKNPDISGDIQSINTWYNQNINELDSNVDIGYRKVFFISRSKENTALIEKAIDKFSNRITEDDYITVHRKTFNKFSDTLAKVTKKHNQQLTLKVEIKELQAQLVDLSEHNAKITDELNSIYTSTSWKVAKPLRGVIKALQQLKKNEAKK